MKAKNSSKNIKASGNTRLQTNQRLDSGAIEFEHSELRTNAKQKLPKNGDMVPVIKTDDNNFSYLLEHSNIDKEPELMIKEEEWNNIRHLESISGINDMSADLMRATQGASKRKPIETYNPSQNYNKKGNSGQVHLKNSGPQTRQRKPQDVSISNQNIGNGDVTPSEIHQENLTITNHSIIINNQNGSNNINPSGKVQPIKDLFSTHQQKMFKPQQTVSMKNENADQLPSIQRFKGVDVTDLDLSQNKLTEIPDNNTLIIGRHLESLQTFNLSQNLIAYLTPQISYAPQLVHLNLQNNQLTFLPEQIGSLRHLEKLNLSENQLFNLPTSIGQLSDSLKALYLSRNKLEFLPVELGNLVNLEILFIDYNRFTAIPSSIANLTNLKEFALDWLNYTTPPLPTPFPTINSNNPVDLMQDLIQMIQSLAQEQPYEIGLIDFIQFFSDVPQGSELDTTLAHQASYYGDIGVLKGLIEYQQSQDTDEMSVSMVDGQGNTVNLDLLNSIDKNGLSPLCIAIREGQSEAAQMLIEAQVDVHAGGGKFGSALHLAVCKGDLLLTDMLIKRDADCTRVNSIEETPLHQLFQVYKKQSKFKAIAECLVLAAADPNAQNSNKWAPIHIVARNDIIDAIRWMKDINQILKKLGMETFNFNLPGGPMDWTPLHLAGYSGSYKVVEEILATNYEDRDEQTTNAGSASQHNINNLNSSRQLDINVLNSAIKNQQQHEQADPPIDVFVRNQDQNLPRQCTRNNVLNKIFRKAEKKVTLDRLMNKTVAMQSSSRHEWTVTENDILAQQQSFQKARQKSMVSSKSSSMFKIGKVDQAEARYVQFQESLKMIKAKRPGRLYNSQGIYNRKGQNNNLSPSRSTFSLGQTMENFTMAQFPSVLSPKVSYRNTLVS